MARKGKIEGDDSERETGMEEWAEEEGARKTERVGEEEESERKRERGIEWARVVGGGRGKGKEGCYVSRGARVGRSILQEHPLKPASFSRLSFHRFS